jgi:hypothetical protein
MTDFSVYDHRSSAPTSDPERDLERALERMALAIRDLQAAATRNLPPTFRFVIDSETDTAYLVDIVNKRRAAITTANWEPTP